MKIIDTHCHYNLYQVYGEENTELPAGHAWNGHWQQAQKAGVKQSVVVGTTVETTRRALDISSQEPHLFAAIGIHPHEYQAAVENNEAMSADQLEAVIDAHLQELQKLTKDPAGSKIKAVGETGLDYFRLPADEKVANVIKHLQKQALIKHISLAHQLNVPLILHVRDKGDAAYFDTLAILKEHLKTDMRFVLHCVAGPLRYVQEAIEMGGHIGVAGNISYKSSDHIRMLVRNTPSERIVLETDAPFLPPMPHRGKFCEPWMISLTAQFLTDELDLNLDDIFYQTQQFLNLPLVSE